MEGDEGEHTVQLLQHTSAAVRELGVRRVDGSHADAVCHRSVCHRSVRRRDAVAAALTEQCPNLVDVPRRSSVGEQ